MDVAAEMKRLAKAESRAARKSWAVGDSFAQSEESAVKSFREGTFSEKMLPYVGSGLTQDEVAEILGCTRSAVAKGCKRLGILWKTGKPVK